MFEMQGYIIAGAIAVGVAVLGSGYSEKLSDAEMKRLNGIVSKYEKTPSIVKSSRTALKNKDVYEQMTKIYKDKKLDFTYDRADALWKRMAKDIARLKVIQKDNPWWIEDEATKLMKKVSNELSIINNSLRTPEIKLTRIKNEIDGIVKNDTVNTQYEKLKSSHKSLFSKSLTQRRIHKDKIIKIDVIMAPYDDSFKTLDGYRTIVNKNIKLKYDMNYLEFEQNKKHFDSYHKKLAGTLNSDHNSLDSLDDSYSKILSDMKAEYKVSFGRAHWDDYSDWDTTKTETSPTVVVAENDFYKMGESNSDLVASCKKGGVFSSGGCKNIVPAANKYINKNIPRGQNVLEIWIQNMQSKFWHKYTIEKNGKTTESKWMPVSEDFYWKNHSNLGMALETKPVGAFISETVKEPTPPGLSYVGNPNYGSYNSSGNWIFLPLFWNSYGSYGYDRHDYNDYSSYREKRRTNTASTGGYYGRNKSFGTYGKRTYSKGSKFVKPTNSTRKSTLSRSSRSAGSKSRGRGAAGGGK